MKNYLLLLFAFLLLAGCKEIKKEREEPLLNKDTFIYIVVSDTIPAPDKTTEESIYKYIQLFDNHGNFATNNKEKIGTFTSPVYKNKKVKWEFQKNEKNLKIKIKKKETSGNKELIKDKKDGEKGSVIYKVKDGLENGDKEYYNIIITIDGKEYPPIDPVLKWHPQ